MDRIRKGASTAVPCPWCKKKNNHETIPFGLVTHRFSGLTISCMHCEGKYVIVNVQTTISVRKYHEEAVV